MERPFKRHRFSFLSDNISSSYELDTARNQNDLRLKSRFESIFAKYEHDFDGIGDEIDLETGEIVVDNGHLLSMRDEQDTGAIQGGTRFGGGSLLRAMTVAPEEQQVALDSIEEDATGRSLADTLATLGSFNSPIPIESDGEDELLGTPMEVRSDDEDSLLGSPMRDDETRDSDSPVESFALEVSRDGSNIAPSSSRSKSRSSAALPESFTQHPPRASDRPVSPVSTPSDDADSMLGDVYVKPEASEVQNVERPLQNGDHDSASDSDDSLLGHTARRIDEDNTSPDIGDWTKSLTDMEAPTDDAILRQFGPDIGPKVVEVLKRRNLALEATIEPAWRVPDIGKEFSPPRRSAPIPGIDGGSFGPISPESRSLWAQPKARRGRQQKAQGQRGPGSARRSPPRVSLRSSSIASSDSVDPLQEDFSDLGERNAPRDATRSFNAPNDRSISIPYDASDDLVTGEGDELSEVLDELANDGVGTPHESLEDWGAIPIAESHQPLEDTTAAENVPMTDDSQSSDSDSKSTSDPIAQLTNTRLIQGHKTMQKIVRDIDPVKKSARARRKGERAKERAREQTEGKDPRAIRAQTIDKYKTTPAEFKELMRLREVEGFTWEHIYPFFPNHTGKQLNYWQYRYWTGAKIFTKGSNPPWTQDDENLLVLLKPMTNLSWNDLLSFFPQRGLRDIGPRLAKLWKQDMIRDRQRQHPVIPGPIDAPRNAPGVEDSLRARSPEELAEEEGGHQSLGPPESADRSSSTPVS